MTVLQKLVSDVAKLPYAAALDRRVLKPLGMSNSSMHQPPDAADLASGHDAAGRTVVGDYHIYPELAAAGFWTTPTDMALAVCAILQSLENAPNALLPRPIAAEMIKPVVKAAGLGTFVSKTGLIDHAGANWGFRAIYTANPAHRHGYVVMSNGENGEELNDQVAKLLVEAARWHDF